MSMPTDPDAPRGGRTEFDIARDDATKPVAANATGSTGGTAVTPPSNWRRLAMVGGAVIAILLILLLLTSS